MIICMWLNQSSAAHTLSWAFLGTWNTSGLELLVNGNPLMADVELS